MNSNYDKFTFYIDNEKDVKKEVEMPTYVSNGSIGEVIFKYLNTQHFFLKKVKSKTFRYKYNQRLCNYSKLSSFSKRNDKRKYRLYF